MSADLKLAVYNSEGEGPPVLPHNTEVEQGLLGFMISLTDGVAQISDISTSICTPYCGFCRKSVVFW